MQYSLSDLHSFSRGSQEFGNCPNLKVSIHKDLAPAACTLAPALQSLLSEAVSSRDVRFVWVEESSKGTEVNPEFSGRYTSTLNFSLFFCYDHDSFCR
jgi:hypothetical protein